MEVMIRMRGGKEREKRRNIGQVCEEKEKRTKREEE